MVIEKIDHELCNGCGICINVCSVDVIRMDKDIKKAVIRYPDECMLCEMCALDCPVDAISVSPDKNTGLILSWG